MRLAIIQLSRLGDIVNLLPVAHHFARCGHAVDWYVHEEFASILEAVSYARPVIVSRPITPESIEAVYQRAKQEGYDRIYDTQVNGAFRPVNGPRVANFALEPWQRTGCLDLYHDLPLVFDRRDTCGEREAIRRLLPRGGDGRPLLAVALHGFSSRFHDVEPFIDWLEAEFEDFQILDLCAQPLPKPHHLLGPLALADAAICIDSLPLHLTYAFAGLPVIALQPHLAPDGNRTGSAWFRTEPRRHWLGAFTYEQANTQWGRRQIASLIREACSLCPSVPLSLRPSPILHVTCGGSVSPNGRRREAESRSAFDQIARRDRAWRSLWLDENDRLPHLPGDPRKLPFVRDLFDAAAAKCPENGILVLTNADVRLIPEGPDLIRARVAAVDCCYSARADVRRGEFLCGYRDLAGRGQYGGTDLFACTPGLWRRLRPYFPPMLLGREGWDFVLRQLFRRHAGERAELAPPVLTHEIHDAFWKRSPEDPGQRHNRRLGEAWARANGLAHMLALPDWLFREGDAW